MKLFTCLVICVFAEISETKNMALETILQFDKPDLEAAIFIDNMQTMVGRLKKAIGKNKVSLGETNKLTFTEFLKNFITILKSLDAKNLKDVLSVFDDEIRKNNYKGCKFHELLDDPEIRRLILDKLAEIGRAPVNQQKLFLNKVENLLQSNKTNVKIFLNFINLVFISESDKLLVLISKLKSLKDKSLKSVLPLREIIKDGIRNVIIDVYTNLDVNIRSGLNIAIHTILRKMLNQEVLKIRRRTEPVKINAKKKPIKKQEDRHQILGNKLQKYGRHSKWNTKLRNKYKVVEKAHKNKLVRNEESRRRVFVNDTVSETESIFNDLPNVRGNNYEFTNNPSLENKDFTIVTAEKKLKLNQLIKKFEHDFLEVDLASEINKSITNNINPKTLLNNTTENSTPFNVLFPMNLYDTLNITADDKSIARDTFQSKPNNNNTTSSLNKSDFNDKFFRSGIWTKPNISLPIFNVNTEPPTTYQNVANTVDEYFYRLYQNEYTKDLNETTNRPQVANTEEASATSPNIPNLEKFFDKNKMKTENFATGKNLQKTVTTPRIMDSELEQILTKPEFDVTLGPSLKYAFMSLAADLRGILQSLNESGPDYENKTDVELRAFEWNTDTTSSVTSKYDVLKQLGIIEK